MHIAGFAESYRFILPLLGCSRVEEHRATALLNETMSCVCMHDILISGTEGDVVEAEESFSGRLRKTL